MGPSNGPLSIPRSTDHTSLVHGNNSASTPTSQALPIRIRLRVNRTDTTDSNKRNSDINPSTSLAKRQKRAHAMAEPSAANSIRYACFILSSCADHRVEIYVCVIGMKPNPEDKGY